MSDYVTQDTAWNLMIMVYVLILKCDNNKLAIAITITQMSLLLKKIFQIF